MQTCTLIEVNYHEPDLLKLIVLRLNNEAAIGFGPSGNGGGKNAPSRNKLAAAAAVGCGLIDS
jgi:hypothetical protein